MTVAQNIQDLERALDLVKSHPMCGKFEDDGVSFFVFYPSGDFGKVHGGLRCNYSLKGGKLSACMKLIERMEIDWSSSFPGAR